jgi:hypothetical protein
MGMNENNKLYNFLPSFEFDVDEIEQMQKKTRDIIDDANKKAEGKYLPDNKLLQ